MKIIIIIMTAIMSMQNYVVKEIKATPVIYVSDLFHPIEDGDDVYDLATMYAMPTIDLRGVVLEQGYKQKQKPGSAEMNQMNSMTGKNIPYAIGLSDPLTSPTDTGSTQGVDFQAGVNLILSQLQKSQERVNLVTVASLRDIAAAYNRNPQLFKDKVDRILIFAGEATIDYQEYNVGLDPNAFVAIMNSGLNIYWIPCFDGGLWHNDNGNGSYWQVTKQKDLLDGIDPKLTQYFIYNLEGLTSEPIQFINTPVDPTQQQNLFSKNRNLWCAVIFESLTGLYDRELFDFKPVNISVSSNAKISYNQPNSKPVMKFYIRDLANYNQKMTKETNNILKQLRVS